MKILFIIDVSPEIGMGHLSRCLTLCEEFEKCENIKIEFYGKGLSNISKYRIYEPLPNKNLIDTINPSNNSSNSYFSIITDLFKSLFLNISYNFSIYDFIIVDNYQWNAEYLIHLKTICNKIIVIDDIFHRNLYADILITPLAYLTENPYKNKINKECIIYNGFDYSIISNKLTYYPVKIYDKDIIEVITISFGGSDVYNITTNIVRILLDETLKNKKNKKLSYIKNINIILGKLFPDINHRILINTIGTYDNTNININIYQNINIEEQVNIYNKTDLCIGSIGVSTIERAYLGVSQLIITTNDNQKIMADILSKYCIIKYIGNFSNISDKDIINAINIYPVHICNGPLYIDGLGANRIFNILQSNLI